MNTNIVLGIFVVAVLFLNFKIFYNNCKVKKSCIASKKCQKNPKKVSFDSKFEQALKSYKSSVDMYNVNSPKSYPYSMPDTYTQPIQELEPNDPHRPLPFFSSFQLQN